MTDAELVTALRRIRFAAEYLHGRGVPRLVDYLIARLGAAGPPDWPRPEPDRLPAYLRLHDGT
jgi:hypothetical protein